MKPKILDNGQVKVNMSKPILESKNIPFLPNHNLNYKISVKNRIFEIIHEIAEPISGKKKRTVSTPLLEGCDMRLFKAKQFIKDNPHVVLGCDDLASYCDISAKQLNRIFLKYERVSLLEYIHMCKVDEAKRRLSESSSSIQEISEDLGFSSVYYFNRFFTKHIGLTPGDYRKKHLDIAIDKK